MACPIAFPQMTNTDLADQFAIAAMGSLIVASAPEELPKKGEDVEAWCEILARISYYMAATMMDARSTFHEILAESAEEKKNDNA